MTRVIIYPGLWKEKGPGEVNMTFLSEKLKATLYAVATGGGKSIRAICAVSGVPYETIRRHLLCLHKLKEIYARYVLERYCPGDVALVVIDPTYLKELTDGIIVAGLLVPWPGRCIPLYWEHFNWKDRERLPQRRPDPPPFRFMATSG